MSRTLFLQRTARAKKAAIGLAFLPCLLSRVSVAAESDAGMQWRWSAPPECADAAAAKAQVRVLLGPEAWLRSRAASAAVQIVPAPPHRWQATVSVSDGGAGGARFRSLDAPECKALVDAVALLVALTVDSEAVAFAARPTEMPVKARASELPAAVPPRPWQFGAALSGVSVLGLLPAPLMGGELALGVRRGRWSAEVFGARYANRSARFAEALNAGADFRAGAFGARGCSEIVAELGPCAELGWDVIASEGVGASRNDSTQQSLLRLGLGARWSHELSTHWAIRMDAWARVPVDGTVVYRTEGQGVLYESAWAALGAQLGLEFRTGK